MTEPVLTTLFLRLHIVWKRGGGSTLVSESECGAVGPALAMLVFLHLVFAMHLTVVANRKNITNIMPIMHAITGPEIDSSLDRPSYLDSMLLVLLSFIGWLHEMEWMC